MARTTPGTGIPVPESPDPRTITADLWASFSKVGTLITQTSGESSGALTAAQAAQTAAAQALARALAIEEPVHVGPNPPTDGETLWVDTDEDAPPAPVSSEDITDATDVGRAVLTAPLSVDARNALAIYTGTRALLDAGTDTAERTWDAKELHDYVADNSGASTWDDIAGKPDTFAPAAHSHTISQVEGLSAALASTVMDARPWFTPIGDTVYLTADTKFVYAGKAAQLTIGLRADNTNGIPAGPIGTVPAAWAPKVKAYGMAQGIPGTGNGLFVESTGLITAPAVSKGIFFRATITWVF